MSAPASTPNTMRTDCNLTDGNDSSSDTRFAKNSGSDEFRGYNSGMRKFAALATLLAAVAALVVGFYLIRRSPTVIPTKAETSQVVLPSRSAPSHEIPEATIHDVVEELAGA